MEKGARRELLINMFNVMGKLLPESPAKARLRKLYSKYLYVGQIGGYDYNNLYHLIDLIREITLLQDGTLFVELRNGLSLYGYRDRIRYKYHEPKDLTKELKFLPRFREFYHMLFEQFVQDLYERHYKLKAGDVFVDVGANIGVATVKAATKLGDGGRIIAIEPDGGNLRLLKKNIEVNKLNNVAIVPKGIWSEKGKMTFIPFSGMGGKILEKMVFVDSVVIEVDTIDSILEELKVDRVDLLKMDIEGGEIEAIKGIDKTLKNGDLKLAIAAYHEIDGKPTYEVIVPELEEKGFKVLEENGIIYAARSGLYD